VLGTYVLIVEVDKYEKDDGRIPDQAVVEPTPVARKSSDKALKLVLDDAVLPFRIAEKSAK